MDHIVCKCDEDCIPFEKKAMRYVFFTNQLAFLGSTDRNLLLQTNKKMQKTCKIVFFETKLDFING